MASGAIDLSSYTKTRNAISSLIVTQLKAVLKAERLVVGGTKTVLADRLEGHLQQVYASNDVAKFQRLAKAIQEPYAAESGAKSSPASTPNLGSSMSYTHSHNAHFGTPPSWHSAPVQLNFKESPFYETVAALSNVQTLKIVEQSRYTMEFTCRLSAEHASRFERGAPGRDSYKILLLGASDPASTFMKLDITFPHQIDVKVNGLDVRSNWKGLKNKPGSTRPADLTENFRKSGNYENTITVTYALTVKRHYLRIDLVRMRSLDSLVQKLKDGKTILKEQVLRDMRNKAKDSDIVATSTVMSLKCPLSYTRLKTPCRGAQCSHNQCFDAMSYLLLQQQAPTWLCPICSKVATFDNLQIDQYVADIIGSVSEEVEQVSITPEGEWSEVSAGDSNRGRPGVKSETDSDEDDLIEISHPTSTRQSVSHTPLTSTQELRTPSSQPQGQSSDSGRNPTNKRAHAVVDLTLDSSEDEGPAPKRTATSTSQHHNRPVFGQSGLSTSTNGHYLPTMSNSNYGYLQGRPSTPAARSYEYQNSSDSYRS